MPQSLSHVILHIIFSTKDRMCLLNDNVRDEMHSYLATVCRNHGCHAYRIGGTADHVHIATTLSRDLTQKDLVRLRKHPSSKWMKKKGGDHGGFYWQRGYGVFSVSASHLDKLIAYIDGQEKHHRKVSFREEFHAFLKRYGVAYDERYVWD